MATLLWSQEFNSPLDLKSPSNPNGLWMADDYWQSPTMGYEDFAGQSFNINPNDPATAVFNPFSVSNGVLTITAERTPASLVQPIANEMAIQGQSGPAPQWVGGILITNPAVHTFTYGYIEFKARFDAGNGEFPALWFYSADGNLNPGKTSAEIDLNEIYGKAGTFYTSQNGATNGNLFYTNTDTTQWHTYGMDWHPNQIDFYEDGKLIYSMPPDQAAYFNGVKLDLRANFSMDAPWFGTNAGSAHSDASTPNQLHMQIDYIRQYDTFPGVAPPDPPPPPPPPTDHPGVLTETSNPAGFAVGAVATAHLSDPDGVQAGTEHYQWLLDGNPIAGATLDTFVLPAADAGHHVQATVSYTDGLGFHDAVAASPFLVASAPVTPPPPPPVHGHHHHHLWTHDMAAHANIVDSHSGSLNVDTTTTTLLTGLHHMDHHGIT